MEQLTKFIDRFQASLKQVPENMSAIANRAKNWELSEFWTQSLRDYFSVVP